MTHIGFTRRGFLKTSGALVVTFAIAPSVADAAPMAPKAKTVSGDLVEGFIAIDAKGNVTIYSGKVDLGTGVQTALTQMAAEELSVPLSKVTVIQGDTMLTPDQGVTFGSLSIQVGGFRIRQACATAREALLDRAAEKLKAGKADLVAVDGTVRPKAGGKGVTYAQLIAGKPLELKIDDKAPHKDPSTYTIVGKSVPRLDIPGKVMGSFTYMQDFKLKGMLQARVIRPPAMQAKLVSFDDSAAKKLPGYVATVRQGNFLAAVARSEWIAIKATQAIKAEWQVSQSLPDKKTLWEHVRNTKPVKDEFFQTVGDSAAALKAGAQTLEASYDFAIHTHGSIGPSCAVAEIKGGKLTVWSASQATHLLRKQVAGMLSMPEADVRMVYIEGSGCYGRNGHEDAAADAALIAKAVGKPVRVQWSRADEHGWDPKGPPTLIDMKAALDTNGNVTAWESLGFLPNRPAAIAVTLVAAELAGLPKEDAHPGNIHQGLAVPYAIPNVKAGARWLETTPFKPSWIRTPGRMQNTFANECFLDECAAAAGIDPLEIRRKNLKDARGLDLLDRLAKLADWKPRSGPATPTGDVVKGRGISYIKYELVRTYVGVVADVSVNRKTGKVVVDKFFVAHDCGQIINPDGLRNQLEGNVIQTVSRTLVEDLQFDRQMVTSLDWATYPILTFPEVPEVIMDLIDRPKERPWGAGEPAAAVIPSAIGNAIFDAVGVRLRSVPFTPDKVLSALKAAA